MSLWPHGSQRRSELSIETHRQPTSVVSRRSARTCGFAVIQIQSNIPPFPKLHSKVIWMLYPVRHLRLPRRRLIYERHKGDSGTCNDCQWEVSNGGSELRKNLTAILKFEAASCTHGHVQATSVVRDVAFCRHHGDGLFGHGHAPPGIAHPSCPIRTLRSTFSLLPPPSLTSA